MATIGLVVGRLRSSYTLISRATLANIVSESTPTYLPQATVKTRVISHSAIQTASVPRQIVEAIRSCLKEYELSESSAHFGVLSSGTIQSHSGQSRDKNVELAKIHGIVCHELSKNLPITHVSIQEARLALGIRTPRLPTSKSEGMKLFLQAVSDRDECSVNTGIQQMSESWGVARLIERRRLLIELRERFPSLVADIGKSIVLRGVADNELKQELMNHEISKILISRFSL